jgi:hypothetical protein
VNGKGDADHTTNRVMYRARFEAYMNKKCNGCEHYLKGQARCTKKTDGCTRNEKKIEKQEKDVTKNL